MIYSLTGNLVAMDVDFAVIDVNGVGYRCLTSTSSLSQLPKIGEKVTFFTYLHFKQDTLALFGFISQDELNLFKKLITVSGVGPKVALALLSGIPIDRLIMSILAGDEKALKVPGVGAKTAQRIILELKDKISNGEYTQSVKGVALSDIKASTTDFSAQSEAISALVSLGYSQTDAAVVISKLDPALSAEDMIKLGLKKLAKL